MDVRNLQISLFDAFGFIFPGAFILFAFTLLTENETVIHIKDSMGLLKEAETTMLVMGTLLSYIIGFLVNSFGYKLYKKVSGYLWEMPDDVKLGREQARYAVLVREFSPRNLAHLEKWNALKAMSHNFSLSFLVLFGVSLAKAVLHWPAAGWEWAILAIVSVYCAYSLLHRAHFYQRYYYEDLRHTVVSLHLEQKAKFESEHRFMGREEQ